MTKNKKDYIGDGAYLEWLEDEGQFLLTTEDGVEVQNKIYLNLDVVDSLFSSILQMLNESRYEPVPPKEAAFATVDCLEFLVGSILFVCIISSIFIHCF